MTQRNPQTDSIASGFPSAPFTLRQLECFIAVADTGSIAGAAELLRASDTAVADAISAMERSLGAKLFHRRRSRGAVPTSDGLAILPLARQMHADSLMLSRSLGGDPSSIAGPVRIGVADPLPGLVLPRIIAETADRFPEIRLVYRTGDLTDLLRQIEAHELDFLITYDLDIPPEYERRKLLETQAMLVVSASHRLAERASVRVAELEGEPMVLLDNATSRAHTLELLRSHGITPTIAHRSSDFELCRSLVGRGLGYALFMRRTQMLDTWEGERLAYVPLVPTPRTVHLLATWPRAPLSPRVLAVVDIAVELGRKVRLAPPGPSDSSAAPRRA